jgi:hypothetical protein
LIRTSEGIGKDNSRRQQGRRRVVPPATTRRSLDWTEKTYTWGLLQGLWEAAPSP